MNRTFILLLFVCLFLDNAHAMRTPIQGLPRELKQLKSREEIQGEKHTEIMKKLDKEMIFFLIDPWIERLASMG